MAGRVDISVQDPNVVQHPGTKIKQKLFNNVCIKFGNDVTRRNSVQQQRAYLLKDKLKNDYVMI